MGFFSRFKKKEPTLEAKEKRAEIKPVKKETEKKETEKIEKKKMTFREAELSAKFLISPIISEKAAIAESRGVYTFMVDKDATKVQIKKAIAAVYGIVPTRVHVMNIQGKWVRHGRQQGKRKDWKKATISLPPGKTISIHEGV